MGSANIQGDLWSRAPRGWAEIQEPQHRPLWEAMLNASDVGPGTRFLDAGCGGGGASIVAAERGAQVSGLDAAEGLLDFARGRVPGGDFRVGDIENLPFDAGAFQTVFAANSVQYTTDRVAALRELGRVVAGLFDPPENVAFATIFKAQRDTMPEPPSGGGPFELSAPGVLEGLFSEAGLTVIESSEADCNFQYPDYGTFWQAMVAAGPTQNMLQVVSEEDLSLAFQQALEPFRLDDGGILIQPKRNQTPNASSKISFVSRTTS